MVIQKWKTDFEQLYNASPQPGTFDESFLIKVKEELPALERQYTETATLNVAITEQEVRVALNKSKSKKAVGIDNLPNEILKNNESAKLLHKLFNKIFQCNLVPSIWKKAIIKPIPKNALIDPHIPMNYRGISLLSTVYKLYTSILNSRLLKYAEDHIYHDEQNGFRPKRSCADHLYVLNTILRHRINQNKDTYVCFIDAEKAFDRVNRDLLFYKMLQHGINGKFYNNLRSLYSGNVSCVNMNGYLSEWFDISMGVRQGDTLSPTLFGIFIDDMVNDIKDLDKGIPISESKLSILLYADDVAIMAENENDLQTMLNQVSKWGHKWHIKFNNQKSQVVHYRKKRRNQTTFKFSLSNHEIKVVDRYKYLGIILQENLDYTATSEVLAGAGGRALGFLLNKYKKLNGLSYNTFTKLYKTCVCPILDYGSEIWGARKYHKIDQIQNRAMRAFLGVHKFAPLVGVQGDMGWTSSLVRRQTHMIRHWNHLLKLDNGRLTKRVFMWDRQQGSLGWASDMKKLFEFMDRCEIYDNMVPLPTEAAWANLYEKECQSWNESVQNTPKLRTYSLFKEQFKADDYVYLRCRKFRSMMSQLRLGILPLEIETGRWKSIEVENRLCKLCSLNRVEDEYHFLFDCEVYSDDRVNFFIEISISYHEFMALSVKDRWKYIMSEPNAVKTAKFIYSLFEKRRSVLFTQ